MPEEMLFVWKSEFSLGMEAFDAQHRNLFRIGGRLVSLVSADAGAAAMAPLVAELVESVRNHFGAEEALMQARGSEGLQLHRAEHQEFLCTLGSVIAEFEAGRANVTLELLQSVQDWIVKHMTGADRAMAAAIS